MNNEIKGNVRRYLTINTTNYNDDGKYYVIDSNYNELTEIGWNLDDAYSTYDHAHEIPIDLMGIGEIIVSEMVGAYLMRIA